MHGLQNLCELNAQHNAIEYTNTINNSENNKCNESNKSTANKHLDGLKI